MPIHFVLLFFFFFFYLNLFAGQNVLDKHEQKALRQTVELLNDSSRLNKAIKENPNAKKLDDQLSSVATKEQRKEVYQIGSKIFEHITKGSKGDPQKMMEALSKNPEEFMKNLPKKFQDQIRGLAGNIEKKQGPKKP